MFSLAGQGQILEDKDSVLRNHRSPAGIVHEDFNDRFGNHEFTGHGDLVLPNGCVGLMEDRREDDVRWLGFDWDDSLYYASDYFEKLYEYAKFLIKKSKAYVYSLSMDEIREYRGGPYRGVVKMA